MARVMERSTDVAMTLGVEIDQFRQRFEGDVLAPGEAGYDEARLVWNGMIDRYPAAIARPRDARGVAAAVKFAREAGIAIAVRGGGHNVAGLATVDGGLVIDLGAMNGVAVDPRARTARVGGGARWGEVDRATQAFGLATPGGVVSDTGVAGLTLSGGLGWLRNAFGLSSDNVIAAQVVTADGRIVAASADENADLFWAIRGGGGNFGIVTEFTFRLYPVGPEVMFAAVFHDGAHMVDGLRFYREFVANAPDALSTLAVLGVFAPVEIYPRALHGRPFLFFGAAYAGPAAEGERAVAPLRRFRTPLHDVSGVMPFTHVQTFYDEDYPSHTMRYYWKSLNVDVLDDAAIETIVAKARRQPSPYTTTDIWHIGGAISRVPEDATAFSGRHPHFVVNVEANWIEPADDARNIAWARDFVEAVRPFSDGSAYLNFPGFLEEGDALVRDTYGAKLAKLAAIKRAYDPDNVFRLNANIRPAD